ncbi:aldo/keto reductase [Allorhizobium taibaishanense]|uniref:D-threo-aldose 1-dehydrogenase n=1 Tax=Allorhizobium taibaishanense TaxID=887144 RepID=A0A1Q9A6D8_9HYPH|nr:aldo/keto reductase [Allorhizobium taibaishanense]MBB4008741.1 D-threo-aldose 1-dehydrogenase [Allorhizobium taibaishanense]OLP50134.1 pyridoxal 4-dehydrogenase [Allorhizobium taibaishanense]
MTLFPTRKLPRADLSTSIMGLGCAQMGNLYRLTPYEEAKGAFDAAWDRGVRYFDTAPHYGHSRSELRLGTMLGDKPRGEFVVSTKVGRLMVPDATIGEEANGFVAPLPFRGVYDYSHDGILRSFEDSQKRLGVIDPDILYIHDIGPVTHGEKDAHYWSQLTDGGGFTALARLRDEGATKAVGLGVNEWEVIARAMDVFDVDVAMLAGRYTLLEQGSRGFLDRCTKAGTAIVVAGAFNSGILAGNRKFNYDEAPSELLARVETLQQVCDSYSVNLQAAALQFPLAHPAVVSVVSGARNASQLNANADWIEEAIPADFWAELKARNLVDAEAVLPDQAS